MPVEKDEDDEDEDEEDEDDDEDLADISMEDVEAEAEEGIEIEAADQRNFDDIQAIPETENEPEIAAAHTCIPIRTKVQSPSEPST